MNILDNDTYFGSYIGQHKIGRKCPFNDGYKGSGSQWKKYILDNHIPVEKNILRMCDSVDDANYWEDYYIDYYKPTTYLWNRYKGGGNHQYDRQYTDEEIAEHQRQWSKRYYEANKEKIAEHRKQYKKQYYEANKEKIAEYNN